MRTSITRFLVVILAAMISATLSATLAAQSNVNMTVEITNARKANARLMQQYTWNSRSELLEAGKVEDTRLELVSYGPDGHLQRSVLNDVSAPLPRGFLRRDVAEHKKEEVEKYLTGLHHLLDQYTLPTEGKVLDFINQATVIGPNASGLLQMTGHSVVVSGDTFTLWTDQRTWQTSRVEVQTSYEGDAVNLDATFATIPSGLAYMKYAEVTIPAKQIGIQVQDFDYTSTVPVATQAAPPPRQPPQPQGVMRAAQPSAAAASPPQPVASPAQPPAAAARLPIGVVVPSLPPGCVSTPVGGVQYFYCGGNFYRAAIQGNNIVYVTAQP